MNATIDQIIFDTQTTEWLLQISFFGNCKSISISANEAMNFINSARNISTDKVITEINNEMMYFIFSIK